MAGDGVDRETLDGLLLAAAPAEIHAPNGGCRAVLQLEQGAFSILHLGGDHLQLAFGLRELERGLHLVALAARVLLRWR